MGRSAARVMAANYKVQLMKAGKFFRLASVLSLILIGLTARTARSATITVTTVGDDDATPNDGSVSFREAIAAINAANSLGDPDIINQNPGTFGTNDTINFNIPGNGVKTINVGNNPSASGIGLPAIVKPVVIDGYTQPGASHNTLANADNAVLLVELNGASAGTGTAKVGIAGLTFGAGSGGSTVSGLVINHFSGDGILVQSSGNTITGNFIGTNPAGTTGGNGMGNANTGFDMATPFRAGIYIDNASSNVIGGTTPDARNIVGGNILDNIHVVGDTGAAFNSVLGNFVGVNAAGTGILYFSGFWGIEVSGVNAFVNSIGGTTSGARNVIGGNADGIDLDDGAHANLVQGNFVGVGADGVTATANRLHGVALRNQGGSPGVSSNLIGGMQAGAGNLVANNGAAGVAVFGDPDVTPFNIDNVILGNSIFNNGRRDPAFMLGIDLVAGTQFPLDDGNTPNDFGDGDAGPNNLQNYPVLTSAIPSNGGTTVTGTFNSRNNNGAGRTYRIEFFSSPAASESGFGEGQTFLGFREVTIGPNTGLFGEQGQGTVSFTAAGLPSVPSGDPITATATQLINGPGSTPLSTSEFSEAFKSGLPALSISDADGSEKNSGTSLFTFTVNLSPASSQTVTVKYHTVDNTATAADHDYTAVPPTVLTFMPFETAKTVTVKVTGDTRFEPDETFFVNLSAPTNATISRGHALGTIFNDDAAPNPTPTPNPSATPTPGQTATPTPHTTPTPTATPTLGKLANISTRGLVQTGDSAMIGGFIVLNGNQKVIVRAIGPSLPVAGALQDPVLELHNGNGAVLQTNDNWRTGGQQAEIIATTVPPTRNEESAIVRTLTPGNYTAVVRGVNNTTGVALVEVFALQ
jgi:hypothetical protein